MPLGRRSNRCRFEAVFRRNKGEMHSRTWAIACFLAFLTGVASAIPGPQPIPVPVVRSSAPSKQIRILNEKEPGRAVDIRSNLVPGRINIVVFFADW